MTDQPDFSDIGEGFLAHYGVIEHRDDNYDARKAHEYYVRNRKLKGRRGVPSSDKGYSPSSNSNQKEKQFNRNQKPYVFKDRNIPTSDSSRKLGVTARNSVDSDTAKNASSYKSKPKDPTAKNSTTSDKAVKSPTRFSSQQEKQVRVKEQKQARIDDGKSFISKWFKKNLKIKIKPFKRSSKRFGSISFKGFGN